MASVCIYLLDSVIDGRQTRLAQVSGVGTLPHAGAGGQMRLALRPVVERADRVEQLHDPVLARDGDPALARAHPQP